MHKITIYMLLLIIFSVFSQQTPARSAGIKQAYTIEYAPMSINKGRKSSGLACTILKEVGKRTGSNIPITFGIWKQVLAKAEKTDATAIFPTTLIDERRDSFIWVGPFCTAEYYIYKSPTKNISISIKEDIINVKSIATVKDYVLNNTLIEQGCKNLKYFKTPKDAIMAVILDRCDICIFPTFIVDEFNRLSGYAALSYAKKEKTSAILSGENGIRLHYGTDHESYDDVARRHKDLGNSNVVKYSSETRIVPVLPFTTENFYFALNKKSDTDTAINMQNALKSIEQDGTLLKMFNKFGVSPSSIPEIPLKPIFPTINKSATIDQAIKAITPANSLEAPQPQLQAQNSTMIIYAEDFPPFSFSTEGSTHIQGAITELILAIQKDLGEKPTPITLLDWNNIFDKAKATPYSVICTLKRIPEREDDFYWIGPYAADSAWLYARTDFPAIISTADDAKKIEQISCVDQTFAYFSLVEAGYNNLKPYNTPNEVVTNMMKDQNTAGAFSSVSAPYVIRNAGYSAANVKPLLQLSKKTNYYIGISKLTPKAVAEAWQQSFEKIRERGELAKILSRWIQ